ncbi:MAG: hypothetical protein JOY85_25845 [Acidobacteriaceae bacterium]|nr:hypothetical protein [Acidobacteriaceae bacterium]
MLAARCRWHDVPDFDFSVANDHTVDEQLDRLAFLLEAGLLESLPHAHTEIFPRQS